MFEVTARGCVFCGTERQAVCLFASLQLVDVRFQLGNIAANIGGAELGARSLTGLTAVLFAQLLQLGTLGQNVLAGGKPIQQSLVFRLFQHRHLDLWTKPHGLHFLACVDDSATVQGSVRTSRTSVATPSLSASMSAAW